MKIYIRSNAFWNTLSGSDQMAVEYAIRYLQQGDYTLEDAVYKACNDVSYGNAEPEYQDEDFYMDEPDNDAVMSYLISKGY